MKNSILSLLIGMTFAAGAAQADYSRPVKATSLLCVGSEPTKVTVLVRSNLNAAEHTIVYAIGDAAPVQVTLPRALQIASEGSLSIQTFGQGLNLLIGGDDLNVLADDTAPNSTRVLKPVYKFVGNISIKDAQSDLECLGNFVK